MKLRGILIVVTGIGLSGSLPLAASAQRYLGNYALTPVTLTQQLQVQPFKHNQLQHQVTSQFKRVLNQRPTTQTQRQLTNASPKVIWNRPLARRAYVFRTTKTQLFRQPGRQPLPNFKTRTTGTWYTSRHAKVTNGTVYDYVTNQATQQQGWVKHHHLLRKSYVIVATFPLHTNYLDSSGFKLIQPTSKLYTRVGGPVKRTLKRSDHQLLLADRRVRTRHAGSFYHVTVQHQQLAGWVASKTVHRNFNFDVHHADWQPCRLVKLAGHEPEPLYANDVDDGYPLDNLYPNERLEAVRFTAHTYLVKKANGHRGVYYPSATSRLRFTSPQ